MVCAPKRELQPTSLHNYMKCNSIRVSFKEEMIMVPSICRSCLVISAARFGFCGLWLHAVPRMGDLTGRDYWKLHRLPDRSFDGGGSRAVWLRGSACGLGVRLRSWPDSARAGRCFPSGSAWDRGGLGCPAPFCGSLLAPWSGV
jgi:hypothetical protein